MVSVSLAGWRQGAIRAAFAFVGILLAALLAVPLGKLVHPLLPHFGASNPITAWALAPIIGFILGSIPLKVAGHLVHQRVEHFYKYNAGDLRLALWSRLNTRLGICIGLLNGATYFVLISFFIFNLTYWTTQATAANSTQPGIVRLTNKLGEDMQASGFSQTANALGTLNPQFYKLADLTGLLMQNPQLGPRLAAYPGFVSLWKRDEMQPLITDPILTNALASGASLGDIVNDDAVRTFIQNKDLTKQVWGLVQTNLPDLTGYLMTGKTTNYTDVILGNWAFNASVTLAWFRQQQPKIAPTELAAVRMLWSQAYSPTTLLLTGDNQIFVKGFPKFIANAAANQPPFEGHDWKGDWSHDGNNYTLHITYNGEDKYLTGTTDGLRLKLKDGHTLLIFDHVE